MLPFSICFSDFVEQHASFEAAIDNTDELMRLMFSRQNSSELLNELHCVNSYDVNACCTCVYKKLILCDTITICTNTCSDKTVWKRERQFRITASRAYMDYSHFQKKIGLTS